MNEATNTTHTTHHWSEATGWRCCLNCGVSWTDAVAGRFKNAAAGGTMAKCSQVPHFRYVIEMTQKSEAQQR